MALLSVTEASAMQEDDGVVNIVATNTKFDIVESSNVNGEHIESIKNVDVNCECSSNVSAGMLPLPSSDKTLSLEEPDNQDMDGIEHPNDNHAFVENEDTKKINVDTSEMSPVEESWDRVDGDESQDIADTVIETCGNDNVDGEVNTSSGTFVVTPHLCVLPDTVEPCHRKNTAGQDTDNYDSLDTLFSDDGLPEYVPSAGLDVAHKPTCGAGACPEPPYKAPKDQSRVRSPVLFGGAQSHFSNFYPCDIHVFGRDFNSVEHAYQYRQAIFHEDFECAEDIKRAKNASAAKRVSKQISKKHEGWLEKRVEVMIEVLKAKAEVPQFREALLATGQAELVEYVESREAFWGVGFGYTGGVNMLGKLLMALREELVSTEMRDAHSFGAMRGGHGQRISTTRQSEQSQSRRWNESRTRTNDHPGMFSRDDRDDTNWRRRNSRWAGQNTVGRPGKKRYHQGDDYGDRRAGYVERVPTFTGQLSNRKDRDDSTLTENTEEMSWDTKPDSREDYRDISRGRGYRSQQDPKDMRRVRGHSSLKDYMTPVRGHGRKEDYKDIPSARGHSSREDTTPCSVEDYMPPEPSTEKPNDMPSSTGCSTTGNGGEMAHDTGSWHRKKDIPEETGSRKRKDKKKRGGNKRY